MLKDLKQLLRLQALDSQIDERQDKKKEVPNRLLPFKEKVKEATEKLRKATGELEELQKQRRHEERELEARGLDLKKYQKQLYEVKDNKAYTALKEEIASTEEQNFQAEEKILEFLEEEEKKTGENKEVVQSLKKIKDILEKEEVGAKEEIKILDGEIARIEARRREVAQTIGADTLARYEKLRKGKEGLAIVLLEGSSCGGCHMSLPPQKVNEVKKGDKFITCDNCNRILCWPEEGIEE
jgi:predicted  nucleic acid-binding Zn-ribbon protein